MAKFLTKLEDSQEDWHHAPIWGHSRTHKLFPFYPADIATLQTLRINTVSQIFETHLSGGIDKNVSPDLLTSLQPYPALRHKLTLFAQGFQRMPFRNKYANLRSTLASMMQLDTNMSRRNKLLCRSILDDEIKVAPAYHTRTRDNIQIRPPYKPSTMPSTSCVSHPSHPKRGKLPSKYSTEPSGQTIKHSSHV